MQTDCSSAWFAPEPVVGRRSRTTKIELFISMKSLHSSYCSLSGLNLDLDMWRERCWFEWSRKFTEADLKLVIAHIKSTIENPTIRLRMLSFRYLISQLDNFEEYLAQAKALQRPVKTERQKLIEVWGKPEPEPQAVHVSVALERTKLAMMLKEWQQSLK